MDFSFTLPEFFNKKLAVRLGGLFATPVLIVDGVALQPMKPSVYSLVDDTGLTRRVTFKVTLFDAVPNVQLDGGKPQAIVAKFAWHEYMWIGTPFVLLVVGGALGGLFGGLGLAANARLFRTQQSPFARYALTGVVSIATILAFALGAALVQLLLGRTE